MELMPHQLKAVESLRNGMILYGGVGSGKTITAIEYYRRKEYPKRLIVLTTARKRDELDWQKEAARIGLSEADGSVIVDSWNNITKYKEVHDAFFVFDEQRAIGNGVWGKAFVKIARANRWIILSATPGDNWLDYANVFVANGFYKNITDFKRTHVLYDSWSKYPKIIGFVRPERLEEYRSRILLEMPFVTHTTRIHNWLPAGHDEDKLELVYRQRWNPFADAPVSDAADMFRVMRRVVNSDPSRLELLRDVMRMHPRLIVFYNFNYELDILRTVSDSITIAEWNGRVKNPIPDTDSWLYLVQYRAGAEAWNCTTTNAMLLYSLTYSYRDFEQVQGRIDRLNTPYSELYYYILNSGTVVDRAIKAALDRKEDFNESRFLANPTDYTDCSDDRYVIFP